MLCESGNRKKRGQWAHRFFGDVTVSRCLDWVESRYLMCSGSSTSVT